MLSLITSYFRGYHEAIWHFMLQYMGRHTSAVIPQSAPIHLAASDGNYPLGVAC